VDKGHGASIAHPWPCFQVASSVFSTRPGLLAKSAPLGGRAAGFSLLALGEPSLARWTFDATSLHVAAALEKGKKKEGQT
jgi:hypothetical protein